MMLSRITIAIFALFSAASNHFVASAAGIPQTNTSIDIVERQSPTYFVTFSMDDSQNSGSNAVGYNQISCPGASGSGCNNHAAIAIQTALNNYAGVLQSWYEYGSGTYGANPNYVMGVDDDNNIIATIHYAEPPYLYGDALEYFLTYWSSDVAASQVAEAMSSSNVIQICIEPVDWQDSGYISGGAALYLGWGGSQYGVSAAEALANFEDCNRYTE